MIQDENVSNELERGMRKDAEYGGSIIHLYKLAEVKEFENSVLPKVISHFKNFKKEEKRCRPVKFEENFENFVCNYNPNNDEESSKVLSIVPYEFVQNSNCNVNYDGNLLKFLDEYLDRKNIECNPEKDVHKSADGEDRSFIKFTFDREFEGGPSSTTIICSEYSNEMYVFRDCYLQFPINRDDVGKISGECIIINDEGKNWIKKSELKHKLDELFHADEIREANSKFQKRFGIYDGIDSEKLLRYAFLHTLLNEDERTFDDLIRNFRPLINGCSEAFIPKLISQNGEVISQALLYKNELLPISLEGEEKERDETLVKATRYYHELINKSEVEIDNETYSVLFDKVPLYHLALYFYCNIQIDKMIENEHLFNLCEKYSSELIKTANVNDTEEANTKLLGKLITRALQYGLPELLKFVEEHKIGFYSQNEKYIDIFAVSIIGFMSRSSYLKEPEDLQQQKKLLKQWEVMNFLIEKCVGDISQILSINCHGGEENRSKFTAEFFSSRIMEWSNLIRKYITMGSDAKKTSDKKNIRELFLEKAREVNLAIDRDYLDHLIIYSNILRDSAWS